MSARSLRRFAGFATVFVALAAMLVPNVSAQDGPGSITVTTVAATTGAPVPGASVAITGSTNTSGSTNASGQITFSNLAPGSFGISATAGNAAGQGTVPVAAFTTTNATLGMELSGASGNPWPTLRANVVSFTQSAGGGLTSMVVPTRVILQNVSATPVTNIQLHVAGPSGTALQQCFAGGPGNNPCQRNPAANEALWYIASIAGGSTTGVYEADYVFGGASAGAIGAPDTVWYSWQQGGRSGSYTVNLDGVTNPTPAGPTGTLVVTPVDAGSGNGIPGAPVTVSSNATAFAQTVASGANGSASFTSVPAGAYQVTAGGQSFGITVTAGVTTQARLATTNTGSIVVTASTVSTPGGPIVTQMQASNGSGNAVNDMNITITGPASTAFVSCSPSGCNRPSIANQSGTQWSVGTVQNNRSSGAYSATWAGGTASAGKLGPNTVTVTWDGGATVLRLGP